MRAVIALTAVLAAGALARPALAEVALSGELKAATACEAFQSIHRQTNPGNVRIVAGESYPVRGLNRPNGEWVHIVVDEASPRDRWVRRDCGTLTAAADGPDTPEPPGGAAELRPIFDTSSDGPPDPTPPPPPLDAFDRAVLEVCGPWGSVPRDAAFRAMLDRPELAADVRAMYEALDRGVGERRTDLDTFKRDLTRAWFDQAGFAHIFCGEPGTSTIGGLHFRGRYLQLQEQGTIGRLTSAECRITEIEPPVYTFGVRYRTASGRLAEACPKGYPADLGARDMLIEATLAYESMMRSPSRQMCLKRVTRGGSDYLAVLVVKSGAIRTFYPDATPQCDRRPAPVGACMCGA